MLIKNARFYAITEREAIDALAVKAMDKDWVRQRFAAAAWGPLTALQESRAGWAPPLADESQEEFCAFVDACLVAKLRVTEKQLPASVLNEAVAELVDEMEDHYGRRPGRKEREEIREKVRAELLPRAFTKTHYVLGWLNLAQGTLVVDSASASGADDFVAAMREALGSLPVVPLSSKVERGFLTDWFQSADPDLLPVDTTIGSKLQLVSRNDPTVKSSHVNLDKGAPEITQGLEGGMRVASMAIDVEGAFSAVLHDDLTLKSISLADGVEARLMEESESQRADFMIIAGSIGKWSESALEMASPI